MGARPELANNERMGSEPCGQEEDVHQIGLLPDARDPDVLRAALTREHTERRRAECLARMQADVVQLALDLLVREPDIEGFFGALTKTMVDEGESFCCGVWLLDEEAQQCEPWMAYVVDQLYTRVCPNGIFPR